MPERSQRMFDPEVRASMDSSRAVFDLLTADGGSGQVEEQGGENYYLADPVERRNFMFFLNELRATAERTGNKSVLVAGCGDGLETELLIHEGYEVTAFDYSPNMVKVTADKVRKLGSAAIVRQGDVTDLDLKLYPPTFAGVMFAQVAQFIPPIGEDLLRTTIADLTSRISDGVFYMSTTQYDDPQYIRTWSIGEESFGETTYYARSSEAVMGMMTASGLSIVRHEHFDAGDAPPDDYKNNYFTAIKSENPAKKQRGSLQQK